MLIIISLETSWPLPQAVGGSGSNSIRLQEGITHSQRIMRNMLLNVITLNCGCTEVLILFITYAINFSGSAGVSGEDVKYQFILGDTKRGSAFNPC